MKKNLISFFLFGVALLALSSCVNKGSTLSEGNFSEHVNTIRENLQDQSKGMHELTDSLRHIADKMQDEEMKQEINDIAESIESRYNNINVMNIVDSLEQDIDHYIRCISVINNPSQDR